MTGAGMQGMYKIEQYSNALPSPLFRRLVRAVREVGSERLAESYTTNFWFPAGGQPRNIVEEAITRLYRFARPGTRCVGAEWWLGRLPYGQSLSLHFDRDMTLEERDGETVHPLWSSILYLNRFPSSPTVILDQVLGRDRKSLVPAVAKTGKAVDPVPNRYVVYRGSLYHGVVASAAARKRAARSGNAGKPPRLRLTLLVNFWDRRPLPPVCRDYDGTVYAALRNGYGSGRQDLVPKSAASELSRIPAEAIDAA
jgi:hypothetical protein